MSRRIYLKNRRYYQNRIKHILNYISVENVSVLDLACGEMLLYKLEGPRMKSYLGIDQLDFQRHSFFIQADILDETVTTDLQFDLIFLLGLLDHIDINQKIKLLDKYKHQFKKILVVSQFNEAAWFFKKRNPANASIDLNAYFQNLTIQSIYLFKLPILPLVWDVTNAPDWIKKNCTEKIALISRKS
ncbi:MAG: hypothetical protein IPG95_06350 [Saprospiraceae bacterium]|nr:hypothetical protein [Saprospiraceae bacterium]